MRILLLLISMTLHAQPRTANFSLKGLEQPVRVVEMSQLHPYIELTDKIDLETLTPLELMNVLTETNNVLQTFRPLSVRWDGWSSTMRLLQVPGEERKHYALAEFIVYPSMTSVVHPNIVRNMRPRNYRQLNEWAEKFLQLHPVDKILRMFDGQGQKTSMANMNWPGMDQGKSPPTWPEIKD